MVFSQKPKAARCAHTGGSTWNGQHFPALSRDGKGNPKRRPAKYWNGFQKGEALDFWNPFQFAFAD